jgi:hypothetical protein
VCLNVARDAMQMHALGASVSDIQTGVISKYAAMYPSSTPTPAVPR